MVTRKVQFRTLLGPTAAIFFISLSLLVILFILYVLGELWNIQPFDYLFLKTFFLIPSIIIRSDPLETNVDMGSASLGYGAIIAGISRIMNLVALPFVSGVIYFIFFMLRRQVKRHRAFYRKHRDVFLRIAVYGTLLLLTAYVLSELFSLKLYHIPTH